jgi:small subunit ribosomal protein S2
VGTETTEPLLSESLDCGFCGRSLYFGDIRSELQWEGDVEVLTMKELLETGVHFGHRTRKWNPKMARYIFTERKGIHIIDLEQTVDLFKKAYYHIRDRVAAGGEVLFVGTKKQVQATIVEEAQRCGAHYVNRRWLGGTLTNFGTIKQSIERMKKFETMIEDGTVDHMPNKEASRLRRELAKLQRNLNGLRHLERKPDLLYVIDPDVETNVVREANISGIPVIAIVDTNCNPDPIDFLIPGNDDAIKATKLITARIADAVLEGREGRQDMEEPPSQEAAVAAGETESLEAAADVEDTATVAEEPVGEESEPLSETAAEADGEIVEEAEATEESEPPSETAAEADGEIVEEADATEEASPEPEEEETSEEVSEEEPTQADEGDVTEETEEEDEAEEPEEEKDDDDD